ncbi:MAG: ThiF family adenylyltransferase [Rhodanobacteraceae bacterium]|nr:ThiF family adenylyltransferase [Rhodanobacteraceae bacterium]
MATLTQVTTVPLFAEFDDAFIWASRKWLSEVDVIVDGVDNFEARFLMNELSIRDRIPYVYGGAVGMEGCCMPVLGERPCLECAMGGAGVPGVAGYLFASRRPREHRDPSGGSAVR